MVFCVSLKSEKNDYKEKDLNYNNHVTILNAHLSVYLDMFERSNSKNECNFTEHKIR